MVAPLARSGDNSVMRCVLCKVPLAHEAHVAMFFDDDRENARVDIKGVEWLWRTKNYLDPATVVCCGRGCIERWQDGAATQPIQKLKDFRAAQVEPREKLVSMTTDKFTVAEIEEIYAEILIGGIPEQTPEAMLRELVQRYGGVKTLHFAAERGVAYVCFEDGAHGERFFISCNSLKFSGVPPNAAQRQAGRGVSFDPPTWDVDFLHYIPALNANLYDDLMGLKPTRQLLRAMPRRHPLPREYAASPSGMTPVFDAWAAHLVSLHDTSDYKKLAAAQASSSPPEPPLLITRNWILYKYNLDDSFAKARCLFKKAGGDLPKAMEMIEYTHVNHYYDDSDDDGAGKAGGGKPKRKRKPAAAAASGVWLGLQIVGSLLNGHVVVIFLMVAAIVLLAGNLE